MVLNNLHIDALAPKQAQGLAWLYLLLIIAAESVLVFGPPLWGAILYAAVILSLVISSSVIKQSSAGVFCGAILLIPLMRLMSTGLPIDHLDSIPQSALVALCMVIAIVVYMSTYQISSSDLGLTLARPLAQALFGLTGVLTGILVALVTPISFDNVSRFYIIHVVIIVWVEEVIFRGIVLSATTPIVGRFPAIIYTAVLYAYLFIGIDPILSLLGFVLAIIYGVVALRGKRLVSIILAHSITRIIGFMILPALLQ